MSELESLFLLVGAIYLSECAWWIPRDAIVIGAWWGSVWRCRPANVMPGGERGAACVLQPLPGLGTAVVGAPLTVSLSEEGVLGFAAQCLPPGARRSSVEPRFFTWDALPEPRANDASVEVGGRVFARTTSRAAAAHLAELLAQLKGARVAARSALIEAEVARQFDGVALAAVLGRAERATLELRFLQPALFALVFVAVPLLWAADELRLRWPLLVVAFAMLVVWIAVRSFVAARVMRRKGAWKVALLHLLSPLAAMRARETLLRDVLALHHPLAVAKVLCAPDELASVLERALRDAAHPYWPECPLDDERARRTEAAWRARMLAAIRGLAPDVVANALARPQAETGSKAYCARCLEQYVRVDAACARCGERPLVPFDERVAG